MDQFLDSWHSYRFRYCSVNNLGLGIPVPDYVDENVSDKVVKIIQSYAGVVNKMVRRKY